MVAVGRRSGDIQRCVSLAAALVVGILTVIGGGAGTATASVGGPTSPGQARLVSCPDVGSVEVALTRGVAISPLPAGVHLQVTYRATDARSGELVTGGQPAGHLVCDTVPFAALRPGEVSAGSRPAGVAAGDRLTGSWQVAVTVDLPRLSAPSATPVVPSAGGFPFDGPVRAYLAGRSGSASVAVFDASSGAAYDLNPTSYITASIVKVDILATLVHQAQEAGRGLTAAEQATATQMIEFSDNDAATSLWDEVGGAPGVAAFNRLIGMPNTVPGPGGFWGLTTTTSADQVQLVRAVAYPNAVLSVGSRAYIENLMENVTPSQRWGVSGGVPAGTTIALKNGWLPNGAGWEINSIGHIAGGGHDYVIAVLTANDPSMAYGIATVEGVSSLVWQGLPSGAVLSPQSVTHNSTGAEDVFWSAPNGQLARDYFTGSGAWLGPQLLGGSLRSTPVALATLGPGLDVFYVGSNGGLFHSYFTGSTWVENVPLPGSGVAGGLTVTYNATGAENVFWRATNGQLVHDYFTGSGAWLGPQALGGSLLSDPAAIATRGSGLDVFYVGTNGGLFHSYFTGAAWVENVPLPGSGVAGGLTATYYSTGTENLFWRTTDRQLAHDYFTGAGAWVPGLVPGTGALLGDPAALATGAGGLDVFYAGATGDPFHSYFAGPAYVWVTQRLAGSGVAGLVVPVLTRNGGEDAFFSTASGGLYHAYFTGSGPWVGPVSLPS